MKAIFAVVFVILTACGAPGTTAAPSRDARVKVDETIVATPTSAAQQEATLVAARKFYAFWNTGDEALARAAIAPSFVDRTLPPGRPQGPEGPLFASKHFRVAVPDLAVEVRKMIVAGDYVTVHMEFTGHFTGTFENAKGQGQEVRFIATDVLKVTDGRITDNWHIEDNLTLLKQLGVVH